MYVNRYGHAGLPIESLHHQAAAIMSMLDFGMIEACAGFVRPVGPVFTLSSVDSESGWRTGSILTIEQKRIVHMSVVMSSKSFR